MTIEDDLAGIVDRFNRHAAKNPAVDEELRGLHRTIELRIKNGGTYAVDLTNSRLTNLRTGPPNGAKADLTITTDAATFHGLVRKEIGPMKAIVTRKLTIDGTLEDKLLFRKLL